jgi:hypothetical protein
MYIFLDGCDHCNTFDSLVSWFHVVLEVWLANQQHTRNRPKMRQHAIQASFPAWLGESNLCFTIIFQDLMANTSMSTFWCHTFNFVLSMKGGNALRCAPGNFDDVMIWLEIVHSPIDTPREIFVFVTVFSSTATWDLMTYHKSSDQHVQVSRQQLFTSAPGIVHGEWTTSCHHWHSGEGDSCKSDQIEFYLFYTC